MKVSVIVAAAGKGTRFGGKQNKIFEKVAGRPLFLRTLELFANRDDVKQVLLAIAPEDQELVEVKWGPNLKFYDVQICLGGDERFFTAGLGNDDRDYNYSGHKVLVNAIRKGYRGAFWDILRRLQK